MSPELSYAVNTAEEFRNYKELNLLPSLDVITAYEFMCLDTAERAVRKTQDELQKEDEKKNKIGQDPMHKTGGQGGEMPFKAEKLGLKPQ